MDRDKPIRRPDDGGSSSGSSGSSSSGSGDSTGSASSWRGALEALKDAVKDEESSSSGSGDSGGSNDSGGSGDGKTAYERAVERRREKRRNRNSGSDSGSGGSSEPDAEKLGGMAVGDEPSKGQLRNFRNQIEDKLDPGEEARIAFTGDSLVAYRGPDAEEATSRAKDRGRRRRNQRIKEEVISESSAGWIDESDLRVTERNDRLSVELTDAARREAEGRARAAAKLDVLDQAPPWIGPEDIRLDRGEESYSVELTDRGQREADERARRAAELEALYNAPLWVGEEDLSVTETEGGFTVGLSESGRQEANERAIDRATEDVLDRAPEWVEEEDLSVTETSEGFSIELDEDARRDAPTSGRDSSSSTDEGLVSFGAFDEEERFGDAQLRIGGTSLEDVLEGGAEAYDRFARDFSEWNRDYNPGILLTRETYNTLDPYIGGDALLENQTTGRSRAEEVMGGFLDGVVQLGNVPAIALGVKEGAETLGYLGAETVSGRGGDAVDELGNVGGEAVNDFLDFAEDNPGRTGGMVAGSLVGSVGVLGGAAKVSSRAGRVARYSIQPGEEILSEGATAALRSRRLNAVTRGAGDRVVDRFPNGRIDNEEILIRAGKTAYTRGLRGARRARYDIENSIGNRPSLAADTRGQATLGYRRPSIETEGDGDGYSPPADLLDDSLSQSQDALGGTARAELDARRAQLGDVDRGPTGAGLPAGETLNDRLTFDPFERERVRRRSASNPARIDAPRSDGVDWGRVAELERADRQAARRSSIDVETELARGEEDLSLRDRGRLDTRLEDGLLDRARELDRELGRTFDGETESRSDVGTELFETTGLEQRLGFETELGFDTELGAETELAIETETETDVVEYRPETELDLETELEAETELAIETETETETESDLRKATRERIENYLVSIDEDGRTWRSSIADVDELLGGGR